MSLRVLFTLVAMCWSLSAWATDGFDTQVLSIDTVPSRAQLDALDPNAQGRLIIMATDPHRNMWQRVRALNLLSAYPDTTSRTVLELLSFNPNVTLRAQALYTLARTFGTPGDARLVARLRDALTDPSVQVQTLALRGLRWVDAAAAGALLDAWASDHNHAMASLARHVRRRRRARLATSLANPPDDVTQAP